MASYAPVPMTAGDSESAKPIEPGAIQQQEVAEPIDQVAPSKPETNSIQQETELRASPVSWPQTIWLWKAEIAASILLLVSVFAIVATLYPHAGKPLPDWPFSISINTLLAIYTFVLQGCMALIVGSCISQQQWSWFARERPLTDVVSFAEAGRNGFGAAKWIWAQRLRGPLTTFAAIVTIVSVAVDPFIQQLISFTSCTAIVADNATMPRTNYFQGSEQHIEAGRVFIEPGMQASVNAGLFNATVEPNFQCSTGNCSFSQQYSTVAYCSSCQDISDTLKLNVTCANTTTGVLLDNCTSLFGSNLTSYLPSGLSMVWDGETLEGSPLLVTSNGNDEIVQFLQGQNFFSLNHALPTTLESIPDCSDAATNNTWRCRGYGAAQCTLQPCIKTYSAEVAAGVLNETFLESSDPDVQWGVDGAFTTMGVVDTRCITASEAANLTQLGYNLSSVSAAQPWLSYNSTIPNITHPSDPDTFPSSMMARGCVYLLDIVFANSLWDVYLAGFFSGELTAVLSDAVSLVSADGPQQLATLYTYGNMTADTLDDAFGRMAEALTVYVRENGQANHSSAASGTVTHYATCLNVSWPWIALPAAVITATFLLLAATVAAARRGGAPLWKDSPLALLFHGPVGVEAAGQGAAGTGGTNDMSSVKGMEKAADSIVVRLESKAAAGQGLALVLQKHE